MLVFLLLVLVSFILVVAVEIVRMVAAMENHEKQRLLWLAAFVALVIDAREKKTTRSRTK